MDLFVVQLQHEALHLDTDYKMASLTVHIDNPESRTIHSTSFFLKGKTDYAKMIAKTSRSKFSNKNKKIIINNSIFTCLFL